MCDENAVVLSSVRRRCGVSRSFWACGRVLGGIAQANEIQPGRWVDSRSVAGVRGSNRTQSFRALRIPGCGLGLARASLGKYVQGQAKRSGEQRHAGFCSNAHAVIGARQRTIRPWGRASAAAFGLLSAGRSREVGRSWRKSGSIVGRENTGCASVGSVGKVGRLGKDRVVVLYADPGCTGSTVVSGHDHPAEISPPRIGGRKSGFGWFPARI